MLATVLHELNNPVQTIKNCIYITKVDLPADSPYLETLNIADGELNRIANLVSALREIYRQPKNISFESLSITKLLSEVHTLLNPHLQHLNIVWQQVQPVGPLEVNGIADHLKQVFLNICMNAIEAMQPGGGMLTIDARNDTQNNEVIVAITDTGGGIDPSDMEKIFEPFYTTKEGGSGLGLSICYEIVKKHAGRITTESQPGKGTTFTVSLPIKPGPEQAEEIVR
jgi:two-component system NtrC family sensor kinase